MGIEQLQGNQQQLAVAGNMSATQSLDQLVKSELDKKIDGDRDVKKLDETSLKKALDGKKGEVGTQILAGLAAKLAQTLSPARLLGNLQEEYNFVMDNKVENKDDVVDIKNPTQQVNKTQKEKQNLNSGSGFSGQGEDGQQKPGADIKEYIGAYSQMLVNGGQEAKKKLEKAEAKLQEKGISVKDLQEARAKVATTVRTEIMQQIKHSFLKQVLAKGKSLEGILAKKELSNFIDFAFLNDRIGGYDFGGFDETLQGATDKVRGETFKELREFVKEELDDKVMKKALGDESKAIEKEIDSLLKLGEKIGFDVKGFVAQIPKMKDDLGLNPLIEIEYTDGSANLNNSGGNNREGQHRYKYTPEEEKELLTDKLRALYLRQAVYGDIRTVMETKFKMVTLKNGLIRLGASNFNEIEAEGKGLAKVKLYEMLREGFEERATYAKLSGEAWKMTERKIKTVIKNLENLGVSLAQTELDAIRDKCNERMYQEAQHELTLINMAIEARGEIKYLTQKKKMVIEILDRLAGESGFKAPGAELMLSVGEAC